MLSLLISEPRARARTKKLYAEFRFAIEKKEDDNNDEGI
jgi:hypothetical protein